jgi:hypothetical protein
MRAAAELLMASRPTHFFGETIFRSISWRATSRLASEKIR